jgi:hypothetical protein
MRVTVGKYDGHIDAHATEHKCSSRGLPVVIAMVDWCCGVLRG